MKKAQLLVVAILLSAVSYAQTLNTQTFDPRFYSGATDEANVLLNELNQAFSNANQVEELVLTAPSQNVNVAIQSKMSENLQKLDYTEWANEEVINDVLKTSPEILRVKFTHAGKTFALDLIKSHFVTEGFNILVDDESTDDNDFGLHYNGLVHGDQNSVATLSIFDGEIVLNVASENEIIEITKINDEANSSNLHAIFSTDNVLNAPSIDCESGGLEQYNNMLQEIQNENTNSQYKSYPFLANCVTFWWESEYSLYRYFGSYTRTKNYLLALFNMFNGRLQIQNIPCNLKTLAIWTKSDPFASTSSGGALTNFSSRRRNFGADLATLFSRNYGGGVAWLNTIGSTNDYYRHAVCGAMGGTVTTSYYSWPLNVTVHEVGHNLGSSHTHDCVWNGNNTALDGCGPTAGYTTPCPRAGLPGYKKGSVMSYCHLLGNVGINPAMLFGYQPGQIIRKRVNESSVVNKRKCYNYNPGCTNNFEPNNSRTDAGRLFFTYTYQSMIRTGGDVDYFKVYNPTTANMAIYLKDPTNVDYDIYFYDGSGRYISRNTSSANSTVLYTGARVKGWYYIKIISKSNQRNDKECYDIKVTRYNVKSSRPITGDNQITKADEELKFSLVPNPANDHLVVNSLDYDGDITVTILDASGRTAMASIKTRTDNDIDVSSLTPGFYVVEVKNDKGTYQLKLNVQ